MKNNDPEEIPEDPQEIAVLRNRLPGALDRIFTLKDNSNESINSRHLLDSTSMIRLQCTAFACCETGILVRCLYGGQEDWINRSEYRNDDYDDRRAALEKDMLPLHQALFGASMAKLGIGFLVEYDGYGFVLEAHITRDQLSVLKDNLRRMALPENAAEADKGLEMKLDDVE